MHLLFTHSLIHSPLTTLESKIFLLDEYFLSQTLLIMQTTYHHRFFIMHSIIHLLTHLTTLAGKIFLLDDYFFSQTLLIMQTTYHRHCFFTTYSLFIIHLFTPLNTLDSKKYFRMTIFFHKHF